jgi:hypothetical protein
MDQGTTAGWYPVAGDPGLYRYHDGRAWTEHVRREATAAAPTGGAPGPGWYADPQAPGMVRYWDGRGWTEATRPQEPVGTPSTGGRRIGWLVGLGVAVLALVVGAVVLQQLMQRGAATPEAAFDEMAEALGAQDWSQALRLLPPDEIDWARGTLDVLMEELTLPLEEDVADGDRPVRLNVNRGNTREVAEDLHLVRASNISIDIPENSALGRAGFATNGPAYAELDGRGVDIVVVERNGRWFVSPIGTAMEAAAAEGQLGGASSGRIERAGAPNPDAATQRALEGFANERMSDLLDVVDPEELQVLGHYGHVVGAYDWSGRSEVALDLQTRTEGSQVVLERVSEGSEGFDLVNWCHEWDGDRECFTDAVEPEDPTMAAWLHIVQELSPEVRIATVERDGRSYVSLQETLAQTVEPVLQQLDGHRIAAALEAYELTPRAIRDVDQGSRVQVPLHDGWNTIHLPRGDVALCVGSRPLEDMQVEGYDVHTSRPWGPTASDATVHVMLEGAPTGTSVAIEVDVSVDGDC